MVNEMTTHPGLPVQVESRLVCGISTRGKAKRGCTDGAFAHYPKEYARSGAMSSPRQKQEGLEVLLGDHETGKRLIGRFAWVRDQ
jgi:hypothetical protein